MAFLLDFDGLFALDLRNLVAGLADRDERVREHAVKLSEAAIVAAKGNSPLAEQLLGMTGDLSPRVEPANVTRSAFFAQQIGHNRVGLLGKDRPA